MEGIRYIQKKKVTSYTCSKKGLEAKRTGRFSIFPSLRTSFEVNNKHLISGPKRKSEFFPREGSVVVKGKQSSLFTLEPVIECFVIPPNSKLGKVRKKKRENYLFAR